jgi:hypothetical protein
VTIYIIRIEDHGDDFIPCLYPGVTVQILPTPLLSVTDAFGNVYPLVITPAWNGLNQFFYVAYAGFHDFTGATLSLTITGITPSSWIRYAINFGVFIYGNNVLNVPIIAPLIQGTNLIQLDVLQLYSCGDYIAEYSITIYQGHPPQQP